MTVPFPAPDGPETTKTDAMSQTPKKPSSSARWRSDSPPTVLLGLTRHCSMMRADLTRPHLGAAMSTSITLAVNRNSGG